MNFRHLLADLFAATCLFAAYSGLAVWLVAVTP